MFFAQESGRDKETKSQREEEWERGRVGERKRRREDLSLPGWIVLLVVTLSNCADGANVS